MRVDPQLVAKRRQRVSGAEGMWQNDTDPLSALDTNEGYASRLIGSPETIVRQIEQFQALGVDMLHLDISDRLFAQEVLPVVHSL
jgi:alkanesulfonate monooxygenase SsuD/methylene tetrahydromethanopterin reductase-like flavin-dependent oxidoreductase (luciferase family)